MQEGPKAAALVAGEQGPQGSDCAVLLATGSTGSSGYGLMFGHALPLPSDTEWELPWGIQKVLSIYQW